MYTKALLSKEMQFTNAQCFLQERKCPFFQIRNTDSETLKKARSIIAFHNCSFMLCRCLNESGYTKLIVKKDGEKSGGKIASIK